MNELVANEKVKIFYIEELFEYAWMHEFVSASKYTLQAILLW